jgi:hypothetical protein
MGVTFLVLWLMLELRCSSSCDPFHFGKKNSDFCDSFQKRKGNGRQEVHQSLFISVTKYDRITASRKEDLFQLMVSEHSIVN